MGSSSSCRKKKQAIQVIEPVPIPEKEMRRITPPKPSSSASSKQSQPSNHFYGGDLYSHIWDKNSQLTAGFQNLKTTKKTTKSNLHEKISRDTKWASKFSKSSDPTKDNSADFNAKIDSETHECINFANSKDTEEFIKSLNEINIELDNEIQRRIIIITNEEKLIIENILEEKQTSEEVLLQQTKLEQEEQEKRYQQLLEDYIRKLESLKLQYLNKLYQKLKDQRLLIMLKSQTNITKVTEQARKTKIQILEQIQTEAAQRISQILSHLKDLSNDSTIGLGGEELTKINMMIFSKFGTKSQDQHCLNISQQDLENIIDTSNTQIKRTIFIKPTTN